MSEVTTYGAIPLPTRFRLELPQLPQLNLQLPSRKKLAMAGVAVTVALIFLEQIPFGIFDYNVDRNYLQHLTSQLLGFTMPDPLNKTLAVVAALLNSFAALTAIPLSFEEYKGHLTAGKRALGKTNCLSRSALFITMLISFATGAAPAVVTIAKGLKNYPKLNIAANTATLYIVTSYYFALSCKDVITTFSQLHHWEDSSLRQFYQQARKSKQGSAIFLYALFKILVTTTYRGVTYYYLGGELWNLIGYKPMGAVLGATTGASTYLLTRAPGIIENYKESVKRINQLEPSTIRQQQWELLTRQPLKLLALTATHWISTLTICMRLIIKSDIRYTPTLLAASSYCSLLLYIKSYIEAIPYEQRARSMPNGVKSELAHSHSKGINLPGKQVACILNLSARTIQAILLLYSMKEITENKLDPIIAMMIGLELTGPVFEINKEYYGPKIERSVMGCFLWLDRKKNSEDDAPRETTSQAFNF